MKIYGDDPNLPYKTTKLKALYIKSEIDGLFAKWGVKDVYWRWDPERNEVFVQFKIVEEYSLAKSPALLPFFLFLVLFQMDYRNNSLPLHL